MSLKEINQAFILGQPAANVHRHESSADNCKEREGASGELRSYQARRTVNLKMPPCGRITVAVVPPGEHHSTRLARLRPARRLLGLRAALFLMAALISAPPPPLTTDNAGFQSQRAGSSQATGASRVRI